MCIRKVLWISYIISSSLIFGYFFRDRFLNVVKFLYKDDILLILDIPRIKLIKDVYNIDSRLNNVDYNIQILKESNINKKIFFLASHSGGGNASYFDNLIYLEKGDLIWLEFNDNKYCYVVNDMYFIQKNGIFNVSIKDNKLFLITCSVEYGDKQLIVDSNLLYEC